MKYTLFSQPNLFIIRACSSLLFLLFWFTISLSHLYGQQITQIVPSAATVGDTVEIQGSGFGNSLGNHQLYFGATHGNIISVSPTAIQVIVPPGATYDKLLLTYNGTHTFSPRPFLPSFDGGGLIDCNSFEEANIDTFSTSGLFYSAIATDLNGDQKVDLLLGGPCCSGAKYLLKNTSTPGTIDSSSTSIEIVNSLIIDPQKIHAIDLDGDGLQDFLSTYSSSQDSGFAIQRNMSSVSTISFDTIQNFGQGFAFGYGYRSLAFTDFDLDGQLDVMLFRSGLGAIPSGVVFFENTSTIGNISLQQVAIDTISQAILDPVISDLDGDGKPDIFFVNGSGSTSTVHVLLNTSSPGIYSVMDTSFGIPASGEYHLTDLNQDGLDDLIIDHQAYINRSSVGQIQFEFSFQPVIHNRLLSIGDLNGDQILDEGGSFRFQLGALLDSGHVGFTREFDFRPFFPAPVIEWAGVLDWDGDGRSDLVHISEYPFNDDYIFIQRNTHVAPPPTPKIDSFSPLYGSPGDTLIIMGDHFGADSKVWMEAAFAEILNISDSVIQAVVPKGAGIGKVQVLTNGFTAHSRLDFMVGPEKIQSLLSFEPPIHFPFSVSPYTVFARQVMMGDGDGDGQIELYGAGYDIITLQDDWSTDSLELFITDTVPIPSSHCTPTINTFTPCIRFANINGDQQMDLAWIGDDCMQVSLNQSSAGAPSFGESTSAFGIGQFSNGWESLQSADFDRDGKPDFALYDGGRVELVWNQTESGTVDNICLSGPEFNHYTQGIPEGLAAGDIDGDGRVDLAALGYHPSFFPEPYVTIYRNTSRFPGDFTASMFDTTHVFLYNLIPWTGLFSPHLIDFDGDGKLDLVGKEYSKIVVMLNTSSPGVISFSQEYLFNSGQSGSNTHISFSDLNRDGKPDILVQKSNFNGTMRFLINTSTIGNPNLAWSASISTPSLDYYSTAMGDINGDGLIDFAGTRNGNPEIYIHLGKLGLGIVNDLPTQICTSIPFLVVAEAEMNADPTNVFQIQLSDSSGQFLTPTILDTIPGTSLDSIWVSIPDSISSGPNYRIRLVSTAPYQEAEYPQVVEVSSGFPHTLSSDTTVCSGSIVNLMATGGTDYLWTPSSGLLDSTISNPSAAIDTSITYHITISDSLSGCEVSDSVIIMAPPIPHVAIDSLNICIGSFAQLGVIGGNSYQWTPAIGLNDPTIPNPTASPVASTMYTVQISDSLGCSYTDSVFVAVSMPPIVDAGLDTMLCQGDTIFLYGSSPMTISYDWQPSASLTANNQGIVGAFPTTSTQYILTGTNIQGCSSTDSVFVQVNIPPTVDAGPDTSVCLGDTVMLTATSPTAISYFWQPAASLTTSNQSSTGAFPTVLTQFVVSVLDNQACTAVDSVSVGISTDTLLSGLLVQSNGLPMPGTKILLIEFNPIDSSLAAVDSFWTDTQGQFTHQTSFADIYLKATPDSATYPMELPTYYDTATVWQQAELVSLDCGDNLITLQTIAGQNPGGNGFIGGLISQGAGKKDAAAVPNLTLILMDASLNPVQLTRTNSDGLFQFDALPLGIYHLWVDQPYVNNELAPEISLSADTMVREDLEFILHPTWLEWVRFGSTSLNPAQLKWAFDLFPNPTNESIHINWTLPKVAKVDMYLSDLAGKQLEVRRVQSQSYSKAWDVSNLASGMYVFSCKPEGMPPIFVRIIKK